MPVVERNTDEAIIPRAYYQSDIEKFLSADNAVIHDEIVQRSLQFDLTTLQNMAWNEEIDILKRELQTFRGKVLFEYTIPRMGKRIDAVVLIDSYVFLLEFKVFENKYPNEAIDQVMDYALDLRNFHLESHKIKLFPILICTDAKAVNDDIVIRDGITEVVRCNARNIKTTIEKIMGDEDLDYSLDYDRWINSLYKPTPTIIEAAQSLYSGHSVQEISHRGSADNDIAITTSSINAVIETCKKTGNKAICFVTGVPGAGKTLVGLNIANTRHVFAQGNEEHAVFLSGNEPLVTVLTEALTRDQVEKKKQICVECKKNKQDHDCTTCLNKPDKKRTKAETNSFIQMIHRFRDDSLLEGHPAPIDKIAIFDEAQRAWTKSKLSDFMKKKKGQPYFNMSEPECLVEYMDRHSGWACIVCLVGGGQEIYDGEAGVEEWLNALNNRFTDWKIYYSDKMTGDEYLGHNSIQELLSNMKVKPEVKSELHLSASMRSFRSEIVSDYARALINNEAEKATELYSKITEIDKETGNCKYPIFLTRDLDTAKRKVRELSRGSERYGIIASSGAKRLRADGIIVPKDIKVDKWFLGNKNDVDSSYYMEVAASEFKIQGLEIDYAVVAWEGDYRYKDGDFTCNLFKGSKWQKVNNLIEKRYLKNSYRVLLTRARQGYVIYVPKGSEKDKTRSTGYYDETYKYLKRIGITEL